MFTKYEADLLCQNITYITTKGRGVSVSHPVYSILPMRHLYDVGKNGFVAMETDALSSCAVPSRTSLPSFVVISP